MKYKILKTPTTLLLLLMGALNLQTAQAVNCGDYVSSDVVLTNNLECNTGFFALEVVNHNVTIDLNGYILAGPSELSGINVIGYDNVVVKNGSIKGFWAGVNSSRSENLDVNNMTFYETGHGVIIHAGNKARIQDNDFIRTTSTAIDLSVRAKFLTANRNLISRNEFYQTAGGISICGQQADKNVISDNLIWKSANYGINLNHSDRNQIYGNRILDSNNFPALRLNSSSYNEVKDNTFREGKHTGISILGNAGAGCFDSDNRASAKNQITDNSVTDFATGIVLGLGFAAQRNAIGNRLSDNRISNNNTGIFSQSDTRENRAINNDFTNTMTPIIDFGVNNNY